MNRFAYYPCFKCKKPYFGGQQRCDAGDRDRDFKPDELVCGGCSGADQGGCTIHGKEFMYVSRGIYPCFRTILTWVGVGSTSVSIVVE